MGFANSVSRADVVCGVSVGGIHARSAVVCDEEDAGLLCSDGLWEVGRGESKVDCDDGFLPGGLGRPGLEVDGTCCIGRDGRVSAVELTVTGLGGCSFSMSSAISKQQHTVRFFGLRRRCGAGFACGSLISRTPSRSIRVSMLVRGFGRGCREGRVDPGSFDTAA